MPDSVRKILEDTRELLLSQAAMGLSDLPRSPELQGFLSGPAAPTPPQAGPPHSSPKAKPPRPAPASRPLPPIFPGNAQPISEIHQELATCRLCPLHQTRKTVVAGSGTGASGLLVIEGQPGEVEEATATPLSGESGELFDKMLKAIGLDREQIYLTSLVKCRPPGDREASEAEIHTCLNFLFRQIAAVNPAVICGLGPTAARLLTGRSQPLFQLRGRFHDFHGTPLMVTFHPLFLLRNPEMKKGSWQDLQLIERKLPLSAR